jgi:hypothetical protein
MITINLDDGVNAGQVESALSVMRAMSVSNVHAKDNEAAVVAEYMDLPTLASRNISWLLQSMIMMLFSSRPSLLKGGYNGDAFLSGLLSLSTSANIRECVCKFASSLYSFLWFKSWYLYWNWRAGCRYMVRTLPVLHGGVPSNGQFWVTLCSNVRNSCVSFLWF